MINTESSLHKKTEIHIIANASSLDKRSAALSGGDRIYIELARSWAQTGCAVNVYFWEEGLKMCRDVYNLPGVTYHLWTAKVIQKLPFVIGYFYRIVSGVLHALFLKLPGEPIVYSASDFWQDSLPALILKCKNRKIRWIAGFYLFAPQFWRKSSPYRGWRFFIGMGHWLMQQPVYYSIKRYADMVFVTSAPDSDLFVTRKRTKENIVVIQGGVTIEPSKEYLASGKVVPLHNRRYDACFIGRFHPQKGVLELIGIWQKVCRKNPKAKLAMIGIGGLEKEIRAKIARLGLSGNIELLGFKDGNEKYEIFKQSKIVVHPAVYDSGGMAAAEAMAWGLPGVSFDLEALKTYYPEGMLKTPCFDLDKFAENIITLLTDERLYEALSRKALRLIQEEWDWEKRAQEIYRRAVMRNHPRG
jgi:glycosyltransferase involved in cell wall biosynthesis